MRRTVLATAAIGAALAGCSTAPVEVPGPAAPISGVSASPTQSQITASPTRSATAGPTLTPGRTPSPSLRPDLVPPPLPSSYRTLTLTGFGTTLRSRVPSTWIRTDKVQERRSIVYLTPPGGSELLLIRIDMAPRGRGNADDVAHGLAAAAPPPGYRIQSFMDGPHIGDGNSADWHYTYDRDGTRMEVFDRVVLAGTAQITVWMRYPIHLRNTYLPMLPEIFDVSSMTVTTA